MPQIAIPLEVDTSDIILQLQEAMDYSEIRKFITDLDESIGDNDFTVELILKLMDTILEDGDEVTIQTLRRKIGVKERKVNKNQEKIVKPKGRPKKEKLPKNRFEDLDI